MKQKKGPQSFLKKKWGPELFIEKEIDVGCSTVMFKLCGLISLPTVYEEELLLITALPSSELGTLRTGRLSEPSVTRRQSQAV